MSRAASLIGRVARPSTIIVGLLLIQALLGFVWVALARCPLGVFDLQRGGEYATAFMRLLSLQGADKLIGAIGQNDYFPPLYEIGLGLTQLVLGFGPTGALWLNLALLAAGCWGMYELGQRAGGRLQGVLAAALLGLIPSIALGLRVASKELALALWTPLFLAWVARSAGLSQRRPTLWAAVAFSAGMLIKWNFLICALPAAAAYILIDRPQQRAPLAARLTNLAWAALLAACLLAPWYLGVLDWQAIRVHTTIDPTYLDTGSSWTYYLENLLTHHLLAPGLVLVALGGVVALLRRLSRAAPALIWFAVGYLVLTLLPHKESRYALPLLPAAALLLAHAVCAAPLRALRIGLAALLTLAGLYQVVLLSFVRPIVFTESAGLVAVQNLSCLSTARRAVDWLERSVPPGIAKGTRIVMHPLSRDDVFLGQHALGYWLSEQGRNFDWALETWDSNRYPELVCGLDRIELLLVPLHLLNLREWERESLARDMAQAFPDFRAFDPSDPALIERIDAEFEPVARLQLECGTDQEEGAAGFVLYRRSSSAVEPPAGCPADAGAD